MNYHIDKELLKELADGCDSPQDIKKIMSALCDYSEDVLGRIEKNIMYSPNTLNVCQFISLLTECRNAGEYSELSSVYSRNDSHCNIFINADYEELKEIVGDNGQPEIYKGFYRSKNGTSEFEYTLRFNDRYLNIQKLISELANLYETENAVLFSPYMRKFFDVCISEEIPKNIKPDDISYEFEKNHIPAITNAVLLWNFSVTETELIKADAKIPYGQTVRYSYHFDKKKNTSCLILPKNNQTVIYGICTDEHGITITLDHEFEEFILVEYRNADIQNSKYKKMEAAGRLYSNFINKSCLAAKRILSECDIEYAIYPFRNHQGIKCEITQKLNEICRRYSYKYRPSLSGKLGSRKLRSVMLKFTFERNEQFKHDYINYVLDYLDYYYPEIEWVGGM